MWSHEILIALLLKEKRKTYPEEEKMKMKGEDNDSFESEWNQNLLVSFYPLLIIWWLRITHKMEVLSYICGYAAIKQEKQLIIRMN
jgi:hypothetical protein